MQQFKIVTQHGEAVVTITVKTDPVLDKLGLHANDLEQMMSAVLGKFLIEAGGSETRPTKWDN